MKLLNSCMFGLVLATSILSLTTATGSASPWSVTEECPEGYFQCWVQEINIDEFACCPDMYCYELNEGRLDCFDPNDT